jgi:FMN-dependent NADH-azoreductase
MKVLHIDSSALGAASASRQLSAAAVQVICDSNPHVSVTYRDLASAPPAHLSPALLGVLRPQPGTQPEIEPGVAEEVELTEILVNEFLKADVLVLGAPMYNFSVPSPLKAWIDRVAQAGRTFRYTEAGPVGLAGGKKVLIISSRGGAMSGTPAEVALDHQEAYLKAVMRFFGIEDVTIVRAEGLSLGPVVRRKAIEGALHQLRLLGEEFA